MLNKHKVRYLLIGGYAVVYHGYLRTTADMDIWIAPDDSNAEKVINAIKEFGFDVPDLEPKIISEQRKILRMGEPPLRIEVLSDIDGVEFESCFKNKVEVTIDNVPVGIIGLNDLKKNKKSTGRNKDAADLDYLP